MIEYLYIPLILLLYIRTWKYKQLIDDQIPRSANMWVIVTEKYDSAFYEKQRPVLATFTNIFVFILTCWVIHLQFGWKAALLYALLPTNVSGVAWTTGNYYMTTAFFCITAYFLSQFSYIGHIFSAILYYAALQSTVSAIPYAFFLPIVSWGWMSLLPMGVMIHFLTGKRFQTALKLRKEHHTDLGTKAGEFKINKIFVMTKVFAYYIVLNLWPSRLGFFHDFQVKEDVAGKLAKPSRLFWLSFTCNILFIIWAWPINWKMVVWWYLFIGIFSQFTTYGMFVAERYMYIANIAFCVILATFIKDPVYFAILTTLWFYRSWIYIPAYRHNKHLFIESAYAFPDTPENYNNIASYYIDQKNFIKAAEALLSSLKYSQRTHSFNIMANLAYCYSACGMVSKALMFSRECWKVCPESKREDLKRQIADLERRELLIEKGKNSLRKRGII